MTEAEPRQEILTPAEIFARGKELAHDGRKAVVEVPGVRSISAIGLVEGRPVRIEYGRNSAYQWVEIVGHGQSVKLGLGRGQEQPSYEAKAVGEGVEVAQILASFKRDEELEEELEKRGMSREGWSVRKGFRMLEPDRFGYERSDVFVEADTEDEAIAKYIEFCERTGDFHGMSMIISGVTVFTEEKNSELNIR